MSDDVLSKVVLDVCRNEAKFPITKESIDLIYCRLWESCPAADWTVFQQDDSIRITASVLGAKNEWRFGFKFETLPVSMK